MLIADIFKLLTKEPIGHKGLILKYRMNAGPMMQKSIETTVVLQFLILDFICVTKDLICHKLKDNWLVKGTVARDYNA